MVTRSLATSVSEQYRKRLLDRVRLNLQEFKLSIEPEQIIREVAIFSEKTDIAEEITRLQSHLVQLNEIIQHESDSPGRKLEFVAQEMFREINTIGSKAGDAQISREVVEMKTIVEKIKELLQNIE